MSLFRNTAALMLSSGVGIPLGVLTGAITARYLSLEDRGYFAVAISITVTASILSQLGWPVAAIYRLRRAGAEPARVAGTMLLAAAATSVLAIALGLAFRERLLAVFLTGAPPLALWLALAAIPFVQLRDFFSGLARALDRFDLHAWAQFLHRAALLTALFAVLVVAGGALASALWAVLAVGAAVGLGLTALILRLTGCRLRPDPSEIGHTLRYGAKSWVLTLAGSVHERVDVFMLAWLLQAPAEVALYAVAVGAVFYLRLIPESIAGAIFPEVAGLEPRRAAELTAAAVRHALLWVLLGALGAAATARLLFPLVYGSDYLGSVAPFLILLPGVVFHSLYRLIARYFLAIDRQRVNIAVQLAAILLNAALNLWLIPRYGILGAACASLTSYLLEGLAMALFLIATTNVGWRALVLFGRADLDPYLRRLRELRRRLRPAA